MSEQNDSVELPCMLDVEVPPIALGADALARLEQWTVESRKERNVNFFRKYMDTFREKQRTEFHLRTMTKEEIEEEVVLYTLEMMRSESIVDFARSKMRCERLRSMPMEQMQFQHEDEQTNSLLLMLPYEVLAFILTFLPHGEWRSFSLTCARARNVTALAVQIALMHEVPVMAKHSNNVRRALEKRVRSGPRFAGNTQLQEEVMRARHRATEMMLQNLEEVIPLYDDANYVRRHCVEESGLVRKLDSIMRAFVSICNAINEHRLSGAIFGTDCTSLLKCKRTFTVQCKEEHLHLDGAGKLLRVPDFLVEMDSSGQIAFVASALDLSILVAVVMGGEWRSMDELLFSAEEIARVRSLVPQWTSQIRTVSAGSAEVLKELAEPQPGDSILDGHFRRVIQNVTAHEEQYNNTLEGLEVARRAISRRYLSPCEKVFDVLQQTNTRIKAMRELFREEFLMDVPNVLFHVPRDAVSHRGCLSPDPSVPPPLPAGGFFSINPQPRNYTPDPDDKRSCIEQINVQKHVEGELSVETHWNYKEWKAAQGSKGRRVTLRMNVDAMLSAGRTARKRPQWLERTFENEIAVPNSVLVGTLLSKVQALGRIPYDVEQLTSVLDPASLHAEVVQWADLVCAGKATLKHDFVRRLDATLLVLHNALAPRDASRRIWTNDWWVLVSGDANLLRTTKDSRGQPVQLPTALTSNARYGDLSRVCAALGAVAESPDTSVESLPSSLRRLCAERNLGHVQSLMRRLISVEQLRLLYSQIARCLKTYSAEIRQLLGTLKQLARFVSSVTATELNAVHFTVIARTECNGRTMLRIAKDEDDSGLQFLSSMRQELMPLLEKWGECVETVDTTTKTLDARKHYFTRTLRELHERVRVAEGATKREMRKITRVFSTTFIGEAVGLLFALIEQE